MDRQTALEEQGKAIDIERLVGLVNRCSPALSNPMFVAVVEAAPSPGKADQYVVKQLGWPTKAGMRMRAATNIHLRFPPEVWASLVQKNVCPAFGMFEFSSHPDLPPEMLCNDAVNFGGFTQGLKPEWPLFLRDFLVHTDCKDVTTVDHMFRHDAIILVSHGNDLKIAKELFKGLRFVNFSSFQRAKIGGSPFAVNPDRPYSFWIQHEKFNIFGQMVGIAHNEKADLEDFYEDREFPRFFKVVEIKERRTTDEGYDRIRMCVRCDLGPDYPRANIGWLDFERVQPIDLNLEAVFAIRFLVKISGSIQYFTQNPELITIHRRSHENLGFRSLFSGPSADVWGNKVKLLYDLAEEMESKIYLKGNSFLPLEPILGARLLTDPPDRLGDLFC